MKVSDAGRQKLKIREGERLRPYPDSKGIPTIGVGITSYPDGRAVTMADPPLTPERSDALFRETLGRFERAVNAVLTRTPSQAQFDAMVSLAFNIGPAGFQRSTVVKRFNEGDVQGAADAFLMWNKPPEIMDRRRGERLQFLAGSDVSAPSAPRAEPGPAAPASTPPSPTPDGAPTGAAAPPATPPSGPRNPWLARLEFILSIFGRR